MKKHRKKSIDDLKPLPSEFDHEPDMIVIFGIQGLMMGRMIAPYKDEYAINHQGDLVVFNANIITLKRGKIWYGDLNVSKDFDKLKNIADTIGEDLYILTEYDARWGAENEKTKKLVKKARTVIKYNKK